MQRFSPDQIRAIYDRGPETVVDLITQLFDIIDALEARVSELERQVHRNSRNSSQPPSADGLKKPPPRSQRRPSGRQGGSTGPSRRHAQDGRRTGPSNDEGETESLGELPHGTGRHHLCGHPQLCGDRSATRTIALGGPTDRLGRGTMDAALAINAFGRPPSGWRSFRCEVEYLNRYV